MEKNEGWLKGVLKSVFKNKKFKNEFQETLEDGRVIIVVSEDEDWTGKQVVTQEGEPLEPGDYTLASGKVITVGEGSTIAEVKQAEPAEAENKEEDMSKIKELEAKLAAAQSENSALQAKITESTTVVKEQTQAMAQFQAKFEAKFKSLEEKEKALEEEKKKTQGTAPVFNLGPVSKDSNGKDVNYDPMGEDALSFLRTRNLAN